MQDEIQRLILQVEGREKIDGLNKSLKDEQELLKDLVRQKQGGVGIDPAAIDAAAGKIIGLNAQIKDLVGKSGMGGQGILQASWAVQDFTSVLSGGQGLGRALASVQNNIPGLLMSLGMTGGVAGAVSLVSVGVGALLPVLESLWKSLGSDVPKEAADKLKNLQDEIRKTHEAFLKLTGAPTEGEQAEAAEVAKFLKVRPHAAQAKEAVAEAMGRKSTDAALVAAGTRDEHGALAPTAEMSDETIEKQARNMEFNVARGGAPPGQVEAAGQSVRDRLRGEREDARKKRFGLERSAKDAAAEKVLQDAQVEGPGGDRARRTLMQVADTPGLEGLKDTVDQAITARKQAAGLRDAQRQVQEQIKRDVARKQQQMVEESGNLGRGEAHQAKDHDERVKVEEGKLAARTREDEATEAAAPKERAIASVTALSRQIGRETGGQQGGDPTAEQASQMADQVLSGMNNGLSAQQATFAAVMNKIMAINAAQQRQLQMYEQQAAWANQLGMGGDNNGRGSNLPAMMGAGGR